LNCEELLTLTIQFDTHFTHGLAMAHPEIPKQKCLQRQDLREVLGKGLSLLGWDWEDLDKGRRV
jgi:hypothetical protein